MQLKGGVLIRNNEVGFNYMDILYTYRYYTKFSENLIIDEQKTEFDFDETESEFD